MGGALLPFGGRARVFITAAFCGSILGRLLAQVLSSGLSFELSAVGFFLAPLLAIAYINSKPASVAPGSSADDPEESEVTEAD